MNLLSSYQTVNQENKEDSTIETDDSLAESESPIKIKIADARTTLTNTKSKPLISTQLTRIVDKQTNIETNTISLNRDIYMTWVVLQLSGNWDKMTKRDQYLFYTLLFSTYCIQFGIPLLLFVELLTNPPWDKMTKFEQDAGSSITVISIKMLTMICFSIYIAKKFSNSVQLLTCIYQVKNFETGKIRCFCHFHMVITFVIYWISLNLSGAFISTAETGSDAVLNIVGITFVLQIDDWLYDTVKSHEYVQDSMFDIEYTRIPKEVDTTTYAVRTCWKRLCGEKCVACFYGPETRNANIPSFSKRCCIPVHLFIVCLVAAFTFMGLHYSDLSILRWVGFGVASIYCLVSHIWCLLHGCKIRPLINEFWETVVPDLVRKYADKLMDVDTEEKDVIISKFIGECFEYLYDNEISFSSDNDVKRKIITVMDQMEKFINEFLPKIRQKYIDHTQSVELGIKIQIEADCKMLIEAVCKIEIYKWILENNMSMYIGQDDVENIFRNYNQGKYNEPLFVIHQ